MKQTRLIIIVGLFLLALALFVLPRVAQNHTAPATDIQRTTAQVKSTKKVDRLDSLDAAAPRPELALPRQTVSRTGKAHKFEDVSPEQVLVSRRQQQRAFVRGIVVTPKGIPIPGVQVSMSRLDSSDEISAVQFTDSKGSFDIRHDSGSTVLLRLTKAGFVGMEAPLVFERFDGTARYFTLYHAVAGLTGRILDSVSQRPIPQALIECRQHNQSTTRSEYSLWTTTTNASGAFSLTGLASRETTLVVEAEDHLSRSQVLQLEPGSNQSDIALSPGWTVKVTLCDQSGKWIRNGVILTDSVQNRQVVGAAPTGVALLSFSEKQTVRLVAQADGHLAQQFVLDGNDRNKVITMKEGPLLEGVVVAESGERIPRASVIGEGVVSRSNLIDCETNEEGLFQVRLKSNEEYKIRVHKEGFRDSNLQYNPVGARAITVTLKRGEAGISGRVIRANGQPLKEYVISVLSSSQAGDGPSQGMYVSDLEGRFSFLDLQSGKYILVVTPLPSGAGVQAGPYSLSKGSVLGGVEIQVE